MYKTDNIITLSTNKKTRAGGYKVKSMLNSMLFNKDFLPGFWLAGGCAAN